jgi:hypothetical protein
MKMNGGEIKITQGQFEENNPKYKKYPSFRRNMICEGGGRVKIESLKGGDGIQDGTSLWILPSSSSDCLFIDGITSERKSLFFIPSFNISLNKTEGSVYVFSLSGCLFIPCSLSVSLVFVLEEGKNEGIEKVKNVEWKNEEEEEGEVEKNEIDGRQNEEEVFFMFDF